MTEHDPRNRKDDSFSQVRMGPDSMWAQTCDWLRANGIDPAHVTAEPNASMADGLVTLIMKVRGLNGADLIDPTGVSILTETRTFPVTVPPPPLVEKWLAPKCPTCGR